MQLRLIFYCIGRAPTLFNIQLAKRDSMVVQFKSFLGSRDRARMTETAESDERLTADPRNRDHGPNLRLLIPKVSGGDVKAGVGLELEDYALAPMKTVQQMVDEALLQKSSPQTDGLLLNLTPFELLLDSREHLGTKVYFWNDKSNHPNYQAHLPEFESWDIKTKIVVLFRPN